MSWGYANSTTREPRTSRSRRARCKSIRTVWRTDCSTGVCYNNSGLDIPTAGCQVLDGQQALALSRSRYFQYYADGQWNSDPTSDIGRIERQNLIISAALDKAKSTYNPLRLNTLFSSVVHDFSKDDALSATDLLSLAERYHAFSGSDLQAYTLPTAGEGVVPL